MPSHRECPRCAHAMSQAEHDANIGKWCPDCGVVLVTAYKVVFPKVTMPQAREAWQSETGLAEVSMPDISPRTNWAGPPLHVNAREKNPDPIVPANVFPRPLACRPLVPLVFPPPAGEKGPESPREVPRADLIEIIHRCHTALAAIRSWPGDYIDHPASIGSPNPHEIAAAALALFIPPFPLER